MKVLITQSMLFPWVGMLSQLRLADIIVHYDDVQLSKGGFTNRVQVKTDTGIHWMTVPLQNFTMGTLIDEAAFATKDRWTDKHLSLLSQSFGKSRYKTDALDIADEVYNRTHRSVGSLSRESMLGLADYFGLLEGKTILDSRLLDVPGSGTNRVLDIVRKVGGSTYITGHGARNYLDHSSFQTAGIEVRYMDYSVKPYPQAWGPFTPYVTGLDLVANLGKRGIDRIETRSVRWDQFTGLQ